MKKNIIIVAGLFLLIGIAAHTTNLFITVLIGVGFIYLIVAMIRALLNKNKHHTPDKKLPPISQERTEQYEAFGLNEQEIVFFRETMQTAKEQIKQLEANMNAVSKLKAIDLRVNTVKVAQSLFKRLVSEPNKLHLADQFLYHHLPNLVELSDKYLEINQHDVKTKNSYVALEKSAQMIEQVSGLLLTDYQRIVADDMSELDIELSIAEQNLARQQATNKSVSENAPAQEQTPETDSLTNDTNHDTIDVTKTETANDAETEQVK